MDQIKAVLEKLIFSYSENGTRRFTQDSPVYPEVWLEFALIKPDDRIDLILTPHKDSTASSLLRCLRSLLRDNDNVPQKENHWHMATTGECVVAKLTLKEMIRVLQFTNWWDKYIEKRKFGWGEFTWLFNIVGYIDLIQDDKKGTEQSEIGQLKDSGTLAERYGHLMGESLQKSPCTPVLWSVSTNRKVLFSVTRSVKSTKADACRHIFNIDGSGIQWAVIDSGVDATHIAFRKRNKKDENRPYEEAMISNTNPRPNQTRIFATYDFTKFRGLIAEIESSILARDVKLLDALAGTLIGTTGESNQQALTIQQKGELLGELKKALKSGRVLDWTVISPLIRIPHTREHYDPPKHSHGTHVAGIIAADMPSRPDVNEDEIVGMCPGINIYDIRVLDENGAGDEFSILAALQFIRWLNNKKDQLVIHGVNLSLSIPHSVANYACGRTPVCEESNRLVAEGTVVVAAAGNQGQAIYTTKDGAVSEGFRTVGITDPGNAQEVITVGATHRDMPHTYGVSYFSSRGPTGDGRIKPDLVAPGEKIVSTTPGGITERMDGTSMAAPHVSGAAALLLDKYPELIGQPRKIKEILCKTATDLGRERYFQGHGMLDVLRAMQSI